MKRISSIAILAVAVSIGSLACNKANNTGFTSGANESSASNTATTTANENQQQTTVNRDQAVKELTSIAKQYFGAMVRGDKAALNRLLANNFNSRWQGKVYDKDAWIEPNTGIPNVASEEITATDLAGYSDTEATLHFERRRTYKDGTAPYTERDSMIFVKRDGRWQIKEHIAGH